MAAAIELRVLYGPQEGSRLELGIGEYLLGTSDECSVMLTGPRIEPRHANLIYDGEAVSVEPLDGALCDALGNSISSERPVILGLPVEIGGIWIAVDHADAPWPDPESVAPLLIPSSARTAASAGSGNTAEVVSANQTDRKRKAGRDSSGGDEGAESHLGGPDGNRSGEQTVDEFEDEDERAKSSDGSDWNGEGHNQNDGSKKYPYASDANTEGTTDSRNKNTAESNDSINVASKENIHFGGRGIEALDEHLVARLPSKPASGHTRPRLVRVLAIPVAIAVSGSGIAAWYNHDRPAGLEQESNISIVQPVPQPAPPAIVDFLQTLAPGNKLAIVQEQGIWTVTGTVGTASIRKSIVEGLSDIAPTAVVKIKAEDEIVAAANKVLATHNKNEVSVLRAEVAAEGGLRLTGVATGTDALNAAVEAVRAGLPEATKIETKVMLPDELKVRLKERVAAAGLANKLAMEMVGAEQTLTGTLSAEDTARWESVMVEFTRNYATVLPIRANIVRLKPVMPVAVQILVGGQIPFIVTEKGERVNQGGDINGYTLQSVGDREAVFVGTKSVRVAR